MWKNLGLAALSALTVGTLVVSCSSSTSKDLCTERSVVCDAPQLCDPSDGICKCGGRGGVVCPTGFTCDSASNTCLSTRCANNDCSDKPGTACDQRDGLCKCGGTGGAVCATNEVCNPASGACEPLLNCNAVACPYLQTCDQATGTCQCGTAGCAAGQSCSVTAGSSAKVCVANACAGVTCAGSSVCDPADGECKCNGVTCQAGQACSCPAGSDGGCGATDRVCRTANGCDGVVCPNNHTACDPVDSKCKCPGPGGPVCAASQICTLLPTPQCSGGSQCVEADGGPRTCAGGTSCDPEDGLCKCGGARGVSCAPASTDGGTDPAQICVQSIDQQACRRPCDVNNPDCPTGQYCFFDSSAATPAAYCSAPTDSRAEGQGCTTATSCFSTDPGPHSLDCLGLVQGQTGLCRAYCELAAGNAGCIQVPVAQICSQIPGAPTGAGFCSPQ
jgi:hypothetical protein